MATLARSILALSLVGPSLASGCGAASSGALHEAEAFEVAALPLLNGARAGAVTALIPGKVDAKGLQTVKPVGLVFTMKGGTPSAFFRAIAARPREAAAPGQFYALDKTDAAYAHADAVLDKLASLASPASVQTAGGPITVATVTPASWYASTGGAYRPKGVVYDATQRSAVAALGYRDPQGSYQVVHLTFSGMTGASGGPTPAASEAVTAGSEFTVKNGDATGKGKRWWDTCNPFADGGAGNYSSLSEIPGTSPTVVGGATLTSFATVLVDDSSSMCSL
jgi:hypothetical protein